MPRAASRRLPQCSLVVSGRRCMRGGTGNPPLCRSCRAAYHNAQRVKADTMERSTGSALGDLIGDFFAGNPFDASKVGQVITDLGVNLGGIFGGAAAYSPPVEPRRGVVSDWQRMWAQQQAQQQQQANDQQRRYQQHYEQPPAPPQIDPAVHAARRELGFGPADKLTEELVKDRRRELSRKWHPDLAGTDEKKRKVRTVRMMAINNAADVLLESVRPEAP